MADDGDEEESSVFEIDDFTAASEWERFIYRIEEIIGIHGWKLDNYRHRQSSITKNTRKQSQVYSANNKPTNFRKQDAPSIKWQYQSENLKFASFEFTLQHHKLLGQDDDESDHSNNPSANEELPRVLIEAMDFDFDFIHRTHAIGRWYGLKEFLILSPSNTNKEQICTESRTQLLWSSVGIAMTNLKCALPIFIQIGDTRRHLYYGLCIDGGYRISYEMIHLIYTPHQCNHVQGMIETFKSKLACSIDTPISVSIRFMYVIKDWAEELICYDIPGVESESAIVSSYMQEIPYGPMDDPVSNVQLAVIWPCISSELIVDDESSSELNAFQAPVWKVKTKFVDQPSTLLHENLKRYLQLCVKSNSTSTIQIVRSLSTENSIEDTFPDDVSNVLDRLAEPVPALASSPFTSAVTQATRKIIKTNLNISPLPVQILDIALDFLFPDARLPVNEATLYRDMYNTEQERLEQENNRAKDMFRHFKAAPVGSLTYKTAAILLTVNSIYGVKGFAHLWHEFVLEMRYRLENNIMIPLVAQTTPNLNCNLIHQKIQMLNYCIKRHINRCENIVNQSSKERPSPTITGKSSTSYKDYPATTDDKSTRDPTWNELLANISAESKPGSNSDDSEDEFFEAKETISEKESSESLDTVEQMDVSMETNKQAIEGVKKVTEIKLLQTNEVLRIPITQEPSPMTEDLLIEQQDILARLGTTEEATRIRAQMQSASLLSDMEAFKAANPGCVLADFVRWYSPNDWLPGPETNEEMEELSKCTKDKKASTDATNDEGWGETAMDILLDDDDDVIENEEPDTFGEIGRLSLRMRMPGNTWKEIWELARSVPVKRQKRLLDDTKEAEKVLHYLSNLTPSEIALQLFPTVIMASVSRIQDEDDSVKYVSILEKVAKKISRLSQPTVTDVDSMKEIVNQLAKVEWELAFLTSLRSKFNEIVGEDSDDVVEEFVQRLLTGNEVAVNGAANSIIGKVIQSQLEYQKEENDAMLEAKQKQEKSPFRGSHDKIPEPTGREYILRTSVRRPSPSSRPSPQRLCTVITPYEFRMAGTFSSDTNFI